MKLKIFIPISILFFSISLLLIGHSYVVSNASKEVEYATNILRREVLLRASLIESSYNQGDMRVAYSYIKGFTADPSIRTARIVDSKGNILFSLSPAEEGQNILKLQDQRISDEHMQKAISSTRPFLYYDEENMMLEIAYQLTLNSASHALRPDSNALLIVHKDIGRDVSIYQYKERLFAYIISAILATLSLFLWFLLDRQITRPITLLRDVTRRITEGEFNARANYQSGNEIGQLAMDINNMATSLEESQKNIHNNLARLETSQEYGAIGTWEWDIGSNLLVWSDETYKIFGVERETFRQEIEAFYDLIFEDDRDYVRKVVSITLEHQQPYELRHRIYRDGMICWVLERGDCERDENGKAIRMLGTCQDITQQVEYEDELKAAYDELNHQVMALNQHSIVTVTDARGIITYANDKFVEISGYSSKELIGNTHQMINSGYHDEAFWKDFWTTISRGDIWDGEIRNRKKDGSIYWVKTTILPHINESGKPDRYTSIRTDITALKNAQTALSEEHRLLQTITEIKNAYMYSETRKETFDRILQIYLNFSGSRFGFIAMVRYRPESGRNEVTKLALSDRLPEGTQIAEPQGLYELDLEPLNALYAHVLESGDAYINNQTRDNKELARLPEIYPRVRNFLGMPLYYGENFIGLVGLADRYEAYAETDLDTLKQLNDEVARVLHEIQLRQHNRRLLHAINNSSSEIFVIAPDDMRILDANPAACRNLGYTQEELLQKHFTDICRMSEFDRERLLTLKEENDELISEGDHIKKDGSQYPVEGRVQLITDESPHVLVAIIQDISERKASEHRYHDIQKQLFQSQKMEALGHLTGGIAHDFNNMLASILGYSELSLEILETDKTEVEKVEGYLGHVITASKRARDLITQMLSFSRTKTDSQDNITDVKPVISEVATLLRSSLPTTMKLDYSIEKDLPIAHVQPVQLHQILMNLCINARDAMDGVGEVHIKANRSSAQDVICNGCHNSFSGDFVCIQVSDNGSGIPADSLERIFEPFYTTKETGKGTGMGLSVVHGIVHSNNGHIKVESVNGEGTTFMIYLPVSDTEDISKDTHTTLYAPGRLGGIKAVVVDDDLSVGQFLKEMLELNEVKTRYFSDSSAALEHLKLHHEDYDILISDMTMPNMTGLQLSEELSKVSSDLPVILCSGYSSEKIDQKKCRELGIRACLTKPIDTRQILGIIGELADEARTI